METHRMQIPPSEETITSNIGRRYANDGNKRCYEQMMIDCDPLCQNPSLYRGKRCSPGVSWNSCNYTSRRRHVVRGIVGPIVHGDRVIRVLVFWQVTNEKWKNVHGSRFARSQNLAGLEGKDEDAGDDKALILCPLIENKAMPWSWWSEDRDRTKSCVPWYLYFWHNKDSVRWSTDQHNSHDRGKTQAEGMSLVPSSRPA